MGWRRYREQLFLPGVICFIRSFIFSMVHLSGSLVYRQGVSANIGYWMFQVTINKLKAFNLWRRVNKSRRQSEGEKLFAPGLESNQQAADRKSGLSDQQVG